MTVTKERGRYIDVKVLESGESIDLNNLTKQLTGIDPSSGALVYFIGFVKGDVNGANVMELEYTVIERLTLEQLDRIAREEADRFDLSAVIIWHYAGARRPGDLTLIIATVGRDRHSAFSAAVNILERVKREAPIFKLERRSDGEYWIIGDGVRYPRRQAKA